MRVNPKRNIIVIVFMFLSLAGLSGYVAYSYMQKQPSVIKIKYQQKQQPQPSPPVELNTSKPSPPVEQPSVATVTEQPEKQLTEKNPFKAEFLKKFEKKAKVENITTKAKTPPPPLILPPPPQMQGQDEAKQQNKTEPNINIKGVYKIKDEIIAITDKGDLKIGYEMNGHKIKEITMDGKIIWEKADAKSGSSK